MPKIATILDALNQISPFDRQESWDNSGLLIGSREDEYDQIILALEADYKIIENLKPKSLLITHHPLIFKSLKSFDTTSYPANLIAKLIQKQCSHIAMHTNFDSTHLNEAFAQKIGFDVTNDFQGIRLAKLKAPTTTIELAKNIKKAMPSSTIKITDANKEITQVGIVCGSGLSLLSNIEDKKGLCFISGDLKYHEAMAALSMGVSILDVGHYDSECHFAEVLQRILQKMGYKAIIAQSKNPFYYL